jgi:hypothetical protein
MYLGKSVNFHHINVVSCEMVNVQLLNSVQCVLSVMQICPAGGTANLFCLTSSDKC